MQHIVPHLWFDHEAVEAAAWYAQAFPGSRVVRNVHLGGTPSGEIDIVTVSLSGYELMLLNAGPYFRFNPSVSLMVACQTPAEVDRLHAHLSLGGSDLMELGEYPFSPRYAWTQDRYGLSWQLYFGPGAPSQRITPVQMFTGAQAGQAEAAIQHYAKVFPDSHLGPLTRYGDGSPPNAPNMISHGQFTLLGETFALMDSALDHGFAFNEAVSYLVYCDNQAELDRYWSALSADPANEQCGWLKDRFGFSWQICPREMDSLLDDADEARRDRVMQAMLAMKKLDIAALKSAAQ